MAPSRAKQESSVAGTSRERPHKKSKSHPYPNKPPRRPTREDALPGLQKLKSALRQTKRLLAKENLAANVRVETERRLRSLEADLARAELSRKERQHATKYHRVKFFERQKVVRRINQTKRTIEDSEGKSRRKLESTLADLRVDLNYVLHYPKTKKYVSLFPPEVRQSGSTAEPVEASSDDNEERSRVREMIRQKMEHGELSAEPENELGKLGEESKQPVFRKKAADAPLLKKPHSDDDDVAGDDFFGDDDDEGSEQSEASDI